MEKYIVESIKSIQKQTLQDIEIIAVNDYSSDNSLNILKKLSKKDSRIKIINNKNNRGLLYTRAMGILNSSGEFLMNLDPDDKLNGKNSLKFLYKIVNLYKVDFISFAFSYKNENHLKCSIKNKIIKQPLLKQSAFTNNNDIIDYVLWNKIVKREIMLKAYKSFKHKIYSKKWNFGEDTIWSILININAESMICINKPIYIYNYNNNSLMNNNANILSIKNQIYVLEMYIDIFKNKTEQKYIISSIMFLYSFFDINLHLLVI